MEMYKLAVFILVLNFAFGWVAAMGLVSTRYDNYMEDKINESRLTDTLEMSEGATSNYFEDVWTNLGYVQGAVDIFFSMLYQTTMGLPKMLQSEPFEFPEYIVNMIITFQVVIYGVGIAQFLRGFMIK